MTVEIKPGMRIKHRRLGEGTVVARQKDPYATIDHDAMQICLVMFDSLPEGYSNPFTLDWDMVTPI
jgi:hypothetical protein